MSADFVPPGDLSWVQCLGCWNTLPDPGCPGYAEAWICAGCGFLGACKHCLRTTEKLGQIASDGKFRCASCAVAHERVVAQSIEESLKSKIFGDTKTFAELAAALPWYLKITSATRTELQLAIEYLAKPPTSREISKDIADKNFGRQLQLEKLKAMQGASGRVASEAESAYVRETEHMLKANKRLRTKWSDMAQWCSGTITRHLREMARKFEALKAEDRPSAKIWDLAAALANEREFVLTQILERERTFEPKRDPEEGSPNTAAKNKKRRAICQLHLDDAEVVALFVNWARAEGKLIKSPKDTSVEMLKSSLCKGSLLNAKINALSAEVADLRASMELPVYRAGTSGDTILNAVKNHSKASAQKLLDRYTNGRLTGRVVMEQAEKDGEKLKQQFSDMLNENGICKNCVNANRGIREAQGHRVKECYTFGHRCSLPCPICRDPRNPHWEWECPKKRKRTQPNITIGGAVSSADPAAGQAPDPAGSLVCPVVEEDTTQRVGNAMKKKKGKGKGKKGKV